MKKRTLITVTAAGAVVLGGWSGGASAHGDHGGPGKRHLTLEHAVAKAEGAVKGVAASAELEDGSRWELDVLTKRGTLYKMRISADGKLSKKAVKTLDSDAKADARALKKARVFLLQAACNALGAVPGTVTSVELEHDGRKPPVWEVDIRDHKGVEREVFVSTTGGKVLSVGDEDD